jgi:hypothetical protein
MKNIVILFIIGTYMVSCNVKTDASGNKKTNDSIIVNDSFKDELQKLARYAYHEKDSLNFSQTWNDIIKNDSLYIEYLYKRIYETHRDDTWTYFTDRMRKEHRTERHEKSAIQKIALFLITAIYYKDYSFAFSMSLYNNDSLIHADFFGKKYWCEHYGNIKVYNSTFPWEVKQAQELIESWIIELREKGLPKLRKNKIRPFQNSSLYWYGEKEGKITRAFHVDRP